MNKNLSFREILSFKLKDINHPKHCICVDPVQKLFLFINSEPTRRNPNGDMKVQPYKEFGFLSYESYINTSSLKRIYEINIEWEDKKGTKLSEKNTIELSKIFFKNKEITNQNKKKYWGQLSNELQKELIEYKPKSRSIPKIN